MEYWHRNDDLHALPYEIHRATHINNNKNKVSMWLNEHLFTETQEAERV